MPPISGSKPPKFFGNFPYPYMNGMLHLGHAFSLSKLEFASAYHRLKGDETLFPFAFHCTGMPIKASADKIKNEIAKYGNPPVFPVVDAEAEAKAAAEKAAEAAADAKNADPTKFVAKKSKAQAKAGTASYQWQIMQSSGIPDSDIPPFADPYHWLDYFPPSQSATSPPWAARWTGADPSSLPTTIPSMMLLSAGSSTPSRRSAR